VAVIAASAEELQDHAPEGDPYGLCIGDLQIWHPPGMLVKASTLTEWIKTSDIVHVEALVLQHWRFASG
jgi:hypothetical protein